MSSTLHCREAFDIIEQDLPDLFNPEIKSYDFGDFLFGLGIGDDYNSGFGTPPDYFDYWHYWTRDSVKHPWRKPVQQLSSWL